MEDVILIVEDEVTNQKLFRNVLESRGYTVIVADDGSTDDTASVARSAGARVVSEPRGG